MPAGTPLHAKQAMADQRVHVARLLDGARSSKADPSCQGTHHCLPASDLLAPIPYENHHWIAGF